LFSSARVGLLPWTLSFSPASALEACSPILAEAGWQSSNSQRRTQPQ
jgi:hypothetical protein